MNDFIINCTDLANVIGFTIGMTLLAVLFVYMWWKGCFHNCLKECAEDIKDGWPFYILIWLFGVMLPVTLALMFG